ACRDDSATPPPPLRRVRPSQPRTLIPSPYFPTDSISARAYGKRTLTYTKGWLYSRGMTPERREILQRVADGELSPEEAERILRDLDDETAPPSPDSRV